MTAVSYTHLYEGLEWFLLDYDAHARHQKFVKAMNHFYLNTPSLWQQNYDWSGYQWLDADNRDQSILLFKRQGKKEDDFTIILLNFCLLYTSSSSTGNFVSTIFS